MSKRYEKVIFLDIDGVLNYIGSRVKDGFYVMDETCVARLREVTLRHNARIVISSAWRKRDDWREHITDSFADAGWPDPPIIDRTPNFYVLSRGREIQSWLKAHEVESYIILDDDSDMLLRQWRYFIRTSMFAGGLKEEHIARIDHIWGKKTKEHTA